MRVARYLAGRVAIVGVLLAVLSLVVFVGVDLLPGDPATARLGPGATPEQVARIRERLGLDRPVLDRYGEWITGFVRGDLGTSATGRPVTEMIGTRLGNSVTLTAVAFTLVVPLSLLAGVLLGRRAGRVADRIGSGCCAVSPGRSTPRSTGCWTWSVSPRTSPPGTPASSPAGSANASRSPARWPPAPRC